MKLWKTLFFLYFPPFLFHGTWWEKANGFHSFSGQAVFPQDFHVNSTGNVEISLECFALRSDLLLSTVTKVGKSTGRNLRFLHLRARYGSYTSKLYNNSSFAVKTKMDATAA